MRFTKDIPTFLAAMGSNLLSAEVAAGNSTDTLESQNPNTASNDGDESAWREINDSDDDSDEDEVTPGNNPYADRRIGKKPQAAITAGKHKCPVCVKGFNARSTFVACHSCDKPTHLRCIKDTFNEEQFFCVKCLPVCPDIAEETSNEVPEQRDEEITEENMLQQGTEENILQQDDGGMTEENVHEAGVAEDPIVVEDVLNEENNSNLVVNGSCVQSVREGLKMVDLEHLADLFEAEKIDVDILRDMTHEDLKSIGVSTFGWRHKILKQFASVKSQNIVQSMIDTPPIFEYSCTNCDDTFPSLDNLNSHNGTKHKPRQSCYEGGNLYDDMEIHVMTMTMEEENHPAESTRIRMDSTEYEETAFLCNLCGFECGSDTLLLVHNQSKHGQGGRKFHCSDCSYDAGTMDALIMHENMHHNTLSVTVLEAAVDEIIDLPVRTRRREVGSTRSINVKKLKYRLYD